MNIAKNKILIADDDEDILLLLKYNLEKAGFQIKTTSDSLEFNHLVEVYNPDLIILDVMMSHLNGLELCKQLRATVKFKKTLIFILSAHSDNKLKKEALNIGANGFIDKMNGIRSLKNIIKEVLT